MKKKIILVLAIIFLIVPFSNSQNYIIQVKPANSEVWKYADINGKIIIDCDYPSTYPFSEDGIALEYYPKKDQYILIDIKGKVIPTKIDQFVVKDALGYGARGFSDGLLVYGVGKLWGCMDLNGNVVIPAKYDNLSPFNGGYAIGEKNNMFFVVDKTGKEIPVEEKNLADIKHFEENLAPIISKDQKKGFIGIDGKIAVPLQFKSIGYFSNGIAWAKNDKELVGFINTKGEWIIPAKFTSAKDFDKESGLAQAKMGDTWGYVNEKGEFISFNIEAPDDFFEGLAKGKKGDRVGFYNNKGEWVIKPEFEGARDFKNGFAAVKKDGLWGIIDKEGKWMIKPTFSGIKDVVKLK